MIFGIAVPTRVFGTAAKEIFVLVIIVGTDVLTMIVGTDVPTIIVVTANYWKSCVWMLYEQKPKKNRYAS